MNLFGFDITKARLPKTRNRFLENLIWGFLAGREWVKTTDDTSLLNAYRSWVYVCASKNASTVASTTYKLYVARQAKDKGYNLTTRRVKVGTQDCLMKRFSGLPIVRKAVEMEEVLEHPALDLLSTVNKYMNGVDLFELTDLHQ